VSQSNRCPPLLCLTVSAGRAVRTSSLKHISLRHSRITSAGGVPLALMIRDYPDTMPILMSPTPSNSGTPTSSTTSSPSLSVASLPPPSPLAAPQPVPPPTKTGPVLPPPRHPSQGPVQTTTYTPYIPKSRRRVNNANPPLTPTGQQIPIITSSSQGGVTMRHPIPMKHDPSTLSSSSSTTRHDTGPSAALLDRVRALDTLPRLGALKTLDLKGNDLRVSADPLKLLRN
jgi:protein phosphatase 1 regulatory subunit 37